MIVVGSHGRGFNRFTVGNVSETVALHGECSVEVIRDQNQPTDQIGKNVLPIARSEEEAPPV